MALTTAMALIGSAAIGAGASVFGASSANKAAKKSADATTYAADQSTAEARRQYDLSRADNAPWKAVGQGALGLLASQYGITLPAAGGAGTPIDGTGATPAAGQAGETPAPTISQAQPGQDPAAAEQWQRYLQANPDVAQAWEANKADPAYGGDINNWAKAHYENNGRAEGRAIPDAVNPSGIAPSLTGAGPTLQARPDFTRPAEVARPTTARPETAALKISPTDYQASPDLQFQLDEARKGTEAGASASGALQSGAAAKALQDRAQKIGYGDFDSWVNRQINIFDTANARSDNNYALDAGRSDQNYVYDTNRGDNIFSEDRAYGTDVYNQDRGYLTDRYDKKTGDLFSLSGLGASANAADAAAGRSMASTTSQNLFSTAAAQGKAATTIASNNNQAVGNILGIGQGLITSMPTTQPRPSSNVLG